MTKIKKINPKCMPHNFDFTKSKDNFNDPFHVKKELMYMNDLLFEQ